MTRSSGISRDSCKVLDNFLGTFRLSCTRFTAAGMMSIDYVLLKQKEDSTNVMRILWFSRSSPIFTQARSAIANI